LCKYKGISVRVNGHISVSLCADGKLEEGKGVCCTGINTPLCIWQGGGGGGGGVGQLHINTTFEKSGIHPHTTVL